MKATETCAACGHHRHMHTGSDGASFCNGSSDLGEGCWCERFVPTQDDWTLCRTPWRARAFEQMERS